ncbi:hypothetical protein GJ496_006204 [Pomphorhynchus laevis]|nr:hypothetical protein GJ496_006204 [Pomphorhynchus laevis]
MSFFPIQHIPKPTVSLKFAGDVCFKRLPEQDEDDQLKKIEMLAEVGQNNIYGSSLIKLGTELCSWTYSEGNEDNVDASTNLDESDVEMSGSDSNDMFNVH